MDAKRMLIIGAYGQLGTALREKYPEALSVDISDLDITNRQSVDSYQWENVEHIINAAAYTNVDGAETTEGRIQSWKINATAVGYLARVASKNNISLVHISTDYVFDGSIEEHDESEPFSPLSVYGASKAAGDLLVSQLEKHYIIRTSWVIGEGKNFVRTMLDIGKKGIDPSVVSDQIGRLTFTQELVRGIDHLLINNADYGTYNLTNTGEAISWAEVTRLIYKYAGLTNKVIDVTTEEYFKGKTGIAPRPANSTLSLDKIHATHFNGTDWKQDLKKYIDKELQQ